MTGLSKDLPLTTLVTKPYDYWLIIWHCGAERIHSPMLFEVGIKPEPYCEAVIKQADESKDKRQAKYTGFECHRLVIQHA